jgi:CheY-like chemotaxis protein
VRILVIEDDCELRNALRLALQGEGHDVAATGDAVEAWDELNKPGPSPDVILLDLLMPGMDGRNLRSRQLTDARLASIPTLVITGQALDESTRDSVGAIPVVPKPLDLSYLFAALEEVTLPPHNSKRCGCGRVYDADSWQSLARLCEMDNGRGVGERLELRQCACKSTLAWELGRHALSVRVPTATEAFEPKK